MALNWFNKLKNGLSKSASKVGGALASVTGKKTVDQLTLDDIEDQLILADLGIEASARITKKIKDQKFELNEKKEITQSDIANTLASEIEKILLPCEENLFDKISSNEVSHVKSSQTMKNLFDKPTAVNLLFPNKILTLMTS